MKSYKLSLFTIVFTSVLVTAACSNQSGGDAKGGASGETVTVEHELGTTEVPEKVEKVVTLELGITETVTALGVNPTGVADDDKPERIAASTYEKIEGYTSVGTRAQPNLEVIRSLDPDLIIADPSRHEAIYEELSEIAATIAVEDDTADYNDVIASTETIGKALHKESESEDLIENNSEKATELKENITVGDQTVLQAGYNEGNTFEVPTNSYFLPDFMEEKLDIHYALENAEATSEEMTIEQILQINPDILILTVSEDEGSPLEKLKEDPLFSKLKAVEANQVYEVPHNDWSRRRSIPAANEVMEAMPEIFEEQTS